MARQLKRWESPRREGRNHKGKGGSARQRQLKKQMQMLRKKLKETTATDDKNNQYQDKRGRDRFSSFFDGNLLVRSRHDDSDPKSCMSDK